MKIQPDAIMRQIGKKREKMKSPGHVIEREFHKDFFFSKDKPKQDIGLVLYSGRVSIADLFLPLFENSFLTFVKQFEKPSFNNCQVPEYHVTDVDNEKHVRLPFFHERNS